MYFVEDEQIDVTWHQHNSTNKQAFAINVHQIPSISRTLCVFSIVYAIKSFGPSNKLNDDWLIYFLADFDVFFSLKMICAFNLTNLKLSANDLLWSWCISICKPRIHGWFCFACIIFIIFMAIVSVSTSSKNIIIPLCTPFATVSPKQSKRSKYYKSNHLLIYGTLVTWPQRLRYTQFCREFE